MNWGDISIPSTIDKEEKIDRLVYEPSFFSEGRLAPSAFSLKGTEKKKETYISVFRSNYYSLSEIMPPSPRNDGDRLCGKAELLVKNVEAISSPIKTNKIILHVIARGKGRYPFHAGIYSSIDGISINSENAHTSPLVLYIQ